MGRSILLALVCSVAIAQTTSVRQSNLTARPLSPIVRERAPDQVHRLPAQVQADLISKHCKLPVYAGPFGLTGAYTSGHFRDRTTLDWAVVCHVPDRSGKHVLQRVFVYSPGPNGWKSDQLAFPNGTEPEGQDCEESVSAASPAVIRDYNRALAGGLEQLPSLAHEGVEVGYCEKASEIYFYRAGHWLKLQGAD
jgi:hypothetical protein